VAELRIATRSSPLALWQARHVAGLLAERHPDLTVELVEVSTEGDRDRTRPIVEMAGRGVFVKEVQAAVLDGRADLAVHSAKDLTSGPTPGLVLAAIPPRGDVRDALVGSTLAGLPTAATVASGSARRRALLADLRPDLRFVELRGNMHTRLARAGDPDVDAVVVAAVALERLGLGDHVSERLDPAQVVPQVGQGALAVETTEGAGARLVEEIDDLAARREVTAERAFLAELGGGCDLPVGAWATTRGDEVDLLAFVASRDGRMVLRRRRSGADPVETGRVLADELVGDREVRELLER
jgi:hydroxymethylbilane synthase